MHTGAYVPGTGHHIRLLFVGGDHSYCLECLRICCQTTELTNEPGWLPVIIASLCEDSFAASERKIDVCMYVCMYVSR